MISKRPGLSSRPSGASTYTRDLEAAWSVESSQRRLDAAAGKPLLDVDTTIACDPARLWAFLTSPSLRASWEGPLSITESSPGGRRGVGTVAQCVTGRLATLEEIVDWQPYDHIGWRLTLPGIGPVAATADLKAIEDATRLHVHWSYIGDGSLDAAAAGPVRESRQAALERLAMAVRMGAKGDIEEASP